MIFGTPWWIIGIIGLIIFSGYMSFRAMVAERKLEHEFIEKEGSIYMERLEKEKAERENHRRSS